MFFSTNMWIHTCNETNQYSGNIHYKITLYTAYVQIFISDSVSIEYGDTGTPDIMFRLKEDTISGTHLDIMTYF